MKTVIKCNDLPESSIIHEGFGRRDYCDCYKVQIGSVLAVDEITTSIFKLPGWVDSLMKIRNFIVAPFGLKRDIKKSYNKNTEYKVGSQAGMFKVISRNVDEIVMEENDRHLNFRTSVYISKNDNETTVFLSTIVRFNNVFGRMYFFPVKPFHRIIIRSALGKLA